MPGIINTLMVPISVQRDRRRRMKLGAYQISVHSKNPPRSFNTALSLVLLSGFISLEWREDGVLFTYAKIELHFFSSSGGEIFKGHSLERKDQLPPTFSVMSKMVFSSLLPVLLLLIENKETPFLSSGYLLFCLASWVRWPTLKKGQWSISSFSLSLLGKAFSSLSR